MKGTALVIYWRNQEIIIYADKRILGTISPGETTDTMVQKIGVLMEESQLTDKINRVVCPGGVLKPVKKGCYYITKQASEDAGTCRYGRHRYNQLTCLAYDTGRKYGLSAVMMYPMSSDELLPLNRISGNAGICKYSRYHALEHQIGLSHFSRITGSRIEDTNCIVAYMDELTSVAAYGRGICLDVNDCIGAEGPMGLTSSGDVPVAQIASYFMEKKYSYRQMQEQLLNKSGIIQYTGICNMEELDLKYETDDSVKTACQAMAYQTAKWIGSCALVLKGQVDGILLMGKAAGSDILASLVKKRVKKIAPVFIESDLKMETYMAEEAELLESYACPVYEY